LFIGKVVITAKLAFFRSMIIVISAFLPITIIIKPIIVRQEL